MTESQHTSDNKRIAVNTLMLYGRMIFLTLINIYTVRVTLECLGDLDYGIYEAVASFIGTMGFLNGTMTSATQRFLSYHLGKGDHEGYSHTYSMLLVCFAGFAVLMVVAGELLGHLFVYDILNIPADRLEAAMWVYRFGLINFAFYFLSIPFTAQIVANEKMGVFAYFSIADGMMKLLIVMALLYVGSDRLVLYAGLLAAQTILIDIIYVWYCRVKFRFCRFRFRADRLLLKELGAYTGWNLFGSVSGMLAVQGQGVLLNIFFGPLVNTAKGVANRIYNVIISFATNMFMAFSPQIVKSYASGEQERMIWLAMQSSRLSFFLLLVLSYPLVISMQSVLNMWLGADLVTPLMVGFSQLILVYTLVQALEPPITQMIRATGNIKEYQLKVGICTLMYIPVCVLVLWLGGDPISTMVVLIALYGAVMAVRLWIAKKTVKLSISRYVKTVAWPLIRVSLILCAAYFLFLLWPESSDWSIFFLRIASGGTVAIATVWFAGLSTEDRETLLRSIRNKLPGKKK